MKNKTIIVSIVVAVLVVGVIALIAFMPKNDGPVVSNPTESTTDVTLPDVTNPGNTDVTEPDVETEETVPDSNNSDETAPPSGLEHGTINNNGYVYVDNDIIGTTDKIDIDSLVDLMGQYPNAKDESEWYNFTTDEHLYHIKETDSGYSTYIVDSDKSGDYVDEYVDYNKNKEVVEHMIDWFEDGEVVKTTVDIVSKNEYYETVFDSNGTETRTIMHGDKLIEKTIKRTIGDNVYWVYFRNSEREVFLTYAADGTSLIGYKSIRFNKGETYDWVLDGNGTQPENCISVTITRGGSTKTYTGQSEIPWGDAIDYPPKGGGY